MLFFFFFFNDTATTEIYTLSLHDALPIYRFWFMRPVYEPGVSRNLISANVPNPLTRFWFNQCLIYIFQNRVKFLVNLVFQNRFPTGGDSTFLIPIRSAIAKIFYHFIFKIQNLSFRFN